MPKHPQVLRDREKSLEEQFFARQSEELREKLRAKQERERLREELRRIAVIKREDTIERMLELGITPATWAAIALIPLVEVAWANGRVDAKERRAVLSAAEMNGVEPGGPGHQMLDGWLGHRPDGRLLQAWGEYMVELCAALKPGEKRALRDEQRQQFQDLPGVEKVGRVERVAEIERLLVSDRGKQEGKGTDEEQATVPAPQKRVAAREQEREQRECDREMPAHERSSSLMKVRSYDPRVTFGRNGTRR